MSLIFALALSTQHMQAMQSARDLEQLMIQMRTEARENALREKADRDAAVATVTTRIEGIQGAVAPLLPAIQKLADEMERANARADSGAARTQQYLDAASDFVITLAPFAGGGYVLIRRRQNGKRHH